MKIDENQKEIYFQKLNHNSFLRYDEKDKYVCFRGFVLDIHCEIKPLLGDDYPCVLRKMKNQILLTKKSHYDWSDRVVLLIGTFTSSNTTLTELREIFEQSDIRIMFFNEFI